MHRYPAEEAFPDGGFGFLDLILGVIQIAFGSFSQILPEDISRPIERERTGGQDAFVIN